MAPGSAAWVVTAEASGPAPAPSVPAASLVRSTVLAVIAVSVSVAVAEIAGSDAAVAVLPIENGPPVAPVGSVARRTTV